MVSENGSTTVTNSSGKEGNAGRGLASTQTASASRSKVAEAILRAKRNRKSTFGSLVSSCTSSYIFWIGSATVTVVIAILIMWLYPEPAASQIPVNDPALISQINNQSPSFTAAPVSFFDGWSVKDVKNTFGRTFWTTQGDLLPSCAAFVKEPPVQFDAREYWPRCYDGYTPQEVGSCAGSWAVATASAMSDRVCISNGEGAHRIPLSAQELLSCDETSNGCNGGLIDRVAGYLLVRGLVSERCFPFRGAGPSAVPCKSKCSSETPIKASSFCRANGEVAVMSEVMTHGPVVTLAVLSDNFLVYSKGVYSPLNTAKRLFDNERTVLLHAVKIIGWGEEGGRPYWLVESSFGDGWGSAGVAKVLRSANDNNLLVNAMTVAVAPAHLESTKTENGETKSAAEAESEAPEQSQRAQRYQESNEDDVTSDVHSGVDMDTEEAS